MGDAVSLNTLEFAGSRAQEIAIMEEVLRMGNRDRTKRIFQRLPRHMRRRQMSHNVKRLPRNMREQARNEMQNQGLSKTNGAPKRPSRFFRRRPRRLEAAHAQRQKRVRWLETHIWHAKRFHMMEKWGYRLPDRPTDKGVRAAYRYAARFAALADLSYYQHLEIKGDKENITRLFDAVTDKNVGPSVGARRYESGVMRGRAILYCPGIAPRKVIGDAEFLWEPPSSSSSSPSPRNDGSLFPTVQRTIWFWVHPLSSSRVVETLEEVNSDRDLDCRIADISGRVVRFRLFGPRSIQVLEEALKPSPSSSPSDRRVDGDDESTDASSPPLAKVASSKIFKIEEKVSTWFSDFLDVDSSSHDFQRRHWRSICRVVGSPQQLPRDVVVALTVEDPRLTRPVKKTIPPLRSTTDLDDDFIATYDARVAVSALWRPEVRRQVRDRKLSIADIHILRRANLVPGKPLKLGKYASQVPVILCQHPGAGDSGCWGAGMDVLLPASWGKDFWLSLIYNGARAGGLREVAAANLEKGILTFPRYFPDSEAGKLVAAEAETEAIEGYFAKPIAKRINFLSLGVEFPFRSPWAALAREWSGAEGVISNGDFFVLRERVILQNLRRKVFDGFSDVDDVFSSSESSKYLVPIRVTCDAKGSILPFSLICAPDPRDVVESERRRKHDPRTSPQEPVHRVTRDRRAHLLRAVKKEGRAMGASRFPVSASDPSVAVKDVCSRPTMGFVVDGSLSLSRGKSRGIGFVACNSLIYLSQIVRTPRVLIRCPNSRQYREVDFDILTSVC